MDLKIDVKTTGISAAEIEKTRTKAYAAQDRLWAGKDDFTGWVKLPMNYDKDELEDVIAASYKIQEQCDLLIVIGIGGSYLGARAAIEALPAYSGKYPRVRFAGNNISGTYHSLLLEEMQRSETCLCVISKSGTTTEPSVAFAILKDALISKYGKAEASNRIYAITDREKGVLREEASREGYKSFIVPDDIGGRYSVLTPVGLLPIAAAGIDVRAMLSGAEAMMSSPKWDKDAVDYACARFLLMESGKSIEVIEYYEPQLQYFAEWLKQLFGESEGKEGKGLFPASLSFSADLHSMGQFLQEGSRVFFETVLNVEKPDRDIKVPESAGSLLAGKSMNEVNQAAVNGVIAAHRNAGLPVIKIDIPEMTAFCFGQMVYFFEMTSAVTGLMMGVNPFDQPGVESYKAEMRRELNKNG
ncbi:MAG: glucose-6-phosphate isomerase [Clostridiales bacterium]|nr:glucose-6-phosphate isomerase [Clostridiales bacterium]